MTDTKINELLKKLTKLEKLLYKKESLLTKDTKEIINEVMKLSKVVIHKYNRDVIAEKEKLFLDKHKKETDKMREAMNLINAISSKSEEAEIFKKNLINSITESFKKFGARKTLGATGISNDTYVKILNNKNTLRIDTLIDAYQKIEKNKNDLQK